MIKKVVFFDELSWNSLAITGNGNVAEDEYDKYGIFVGCLNKDNEMIGVVRGIALDKAFPHSELFSDMIKRPNYYLLKKIAFTINSIAVLKRYRGKPVKYKRKDYRTIGQALLEILTDYFRKDRRSICILTAIKDGSDNFFKKLGFCYLGSPFEFSNPPIQLVNMVRLNDYQGFKNKHLLNNLLELNHNINFK
jgi:hypothetical protein